MLRRGKFGVRRVQASPIKQNKKQKQKTIDQIRAVFFHCSNRCNLSLSFALFCFSFPFFLFFFFFFFFFTVQFGTAHQGLERFPALLSSFERLLQPPLQVNQSVGITQLLFYGSRPNIIVSACFFLVSMLCFLFCCFFFSWPAASFKFWFVFANYINSHVSLAISKRSFRAQV